MCSEVKIMDSSTGHRLVHLDLKGAPPKISYFKQIFPKLRDWGATGLLIEYEDMFPYTDQFQVLRSPDCYSVEEIKKILQLAEQNNLIVIPLIQTFGHFEFVLKHNEFSSLRELSEYPMSLCPSKYDSLSTVQVLVDQVMKLHPNVKYFHMGCDEVYHLGLCDDCKKIMEKEKLVVEQLFFSHVNSVATYIKDKYHITPIIWDDMIRFTDVNLLKRSGLADLVEPMVWHYLTKFMLPPDLFDKLSSVFSNIWFASAYKGATGSSMIVTNISYHIDNHLAWIKVIECERSKFKNIQGIALTGWQRYDHYAILCELLPQALPCLALCLQIIQKGAFTPEIHSQVSKELNFTALLPLIPFHISGSECFDCKFSGSNIYMNIINIYHLSSEIDMLLNSTGVLTWMNDYHIKRNFTNPNHIQPIINEATRLSQCLKDFKKKLITALKEVFYESTVEEFIGVYIEPRLTKLTKMVESGSQQLQHFKSKSLTTSSVAMTVE
ncbi:hypothetical protein LOTGIDRAFT_235755 [Lottia gigantea]|uniref:beta-N-acetylhexosaminidase n=1 Tax=Lottia gigantea TaxID=225164 RepID=V3ZXT4_LOTGI|nr:hypothetical protein LOTGIDRAFT_235755 [Lottia gigantea]ESO85796.1 hypothetical protein LOTGIDRAFT_235755 [Lottia gigantea]